jgi:hypothetical protein
MFSGHPSRQNDPPYFFVREDSLSALWHEFQMRKQQRTPSSSPHSKCGVKKTK